MSNATFELGELVTATRTVQVHAAMQTAGRGRSRSLSALALPASLARDPGCAIGFRETARGLGRLRHPNLVAVQDVCVLDGRAWALVPSLAGAPLARLLDVPASLASPLPSRVALDVVLSIAEAAHALREADGVAALGWLAADSIWLLPDGAPVLLPGARAAPPLTEDAALSRYRAPEVSRGEAPGASADVYGLALLLWDLLALGRAHLPVDAADPTSLAPCSIEPAVVQLVMRSLSVSPADRPRDLLVFHADLARLALPEHEDGEDSVTVELDRGSPRSPLAVMPAPVRLVAEPPFPGPGTPPPGRLRVVRGDGGPATLLLEEPRRRWVIGRGRSADLVVCDLDMSREHFEVVHTPDGAYRVHDLGSKNGLFVNGAATDHRALRPGDEVRAGATVLRFEP